MRKKEEIDSERKIDSETNSETDTDIQRYIYTDIQIYRDRKEMFYLTTHSTHMVKNHSE